MLHGDGIHDDTDAIQELLDHQSCVRLATPKRCYLISRPLKVHSRQQLVLDRFCLVRLADHSDCHMLENADPEAGNTDIEITGGVWDMNNLGQSKNPLHFPQPDYTTPNFFSEASRQSKNPADAPSPSRRCYDGNAFFLKNVKNLRIGGLTMKDPVTFAITLNIIERFTVEDITFDFNYGNPWAVNMDGVHVDGQCSFGVIRNLKGSCYDDMVALNADEGDPGPIRDIEVDGLFAHDCHSAVRLLSREHPVEHVSIHHVYGTFYQYCIGLTKYYEGPASGYYDAITLREIYASKAVRHTVYRKDGSFVYPLIWVERGLEIKNLTITDLYRREATTAVETIGIDPEAHIQSLHLDRIVQENHLGTPFVLLRNQGKIDTLMLGSLRANGDTEIQNDGAILMSAKKFLTLSNEDAP